MPLRLGRVAWRVDDGVRVRGADLVEELLDRVGSPLTQELLADLRCDSAERLPVGGPDGAQRLDDVPAVLRPHRLRDLPGAQREGSALEVRDGLTLADRELAALSAGSGVA